jgi:hypothetical protein
MRLAIGIFVVTICLLYGGFSLWARHMHAAGFASVSFLQLVVLAPGFALGVWLIVSAWRKPRST